MQDKKRVYVETLEFMPMYATDGAAGFDLQAYAPDGDIRIGAGETVIVRSGIKMDIPEGYEIQLRSRSGLTARAQAIVAQGLATIDDDFIGEVGLILRNPGKVPFYVTHGMRVCQGVLKPVSKALFEKVEKINKETTRGSGAYGSTGV